MLLYHPNFSVWQYVRQTSYTTLYNRSCDDFKMCKLAAHYTYKAGAAVICCTVFMKTTSNQRRRKCARLHNLRAKDSVFILAAAEK